MQPSSIRFHLSAVFIFFFLLIIVLGMFSISRLRDFNNVSASIADLWLPTTRVLGDLNNFTSDFRAAEGSDLLSSNGSELAAIEMEMAELDRSISQAQYSYEHLRHESDESDLYARFRASTSRGPSRLPSRAQRVVITPCARRRSCTCRMSAGRA